MATIARWKGAEEGPSASHLRAKLGPALSRLSCIGEYFSRLSGFCRAIINGRESITENLGKFLFGSEGDLEKALNDTGAAVRSSFTAWGIGDFAESLMGAPPARPGSHASICCHRYAPGVPRAEYEAITDRPSEDEAASFLNVVADANCQAYSDGLLRGLHLYLEAAPDSGYYSDLRITGAMGAHAELVSSIIELIELSTDLLSALATKEGAHAPQLLAAFWETFPHVRAFASCLLDISTSTLSATPLPEGNGAMQIVLTMSLDFDAAQKHYPRLGELLALLDPLLVQLRLPERDALLMEISMQKGLVQVSGAVRGGKILCTGGRSGAFTALVSEWSFPSIDEVLAVDAVVECSLVPLGPSLGVNVASIPFPKMRFHCERAGGVDKPLVITCTEAMECAFDVVASLAFDMQLFRRFLTEAFRVELSLIPAGWRAQAAADGKWVVHAFLRILFPTASTPTLLAQWFRDFFLGQLRELDVPKALADLFEALAQDTKALSIASLDEGKDAPESVGPGDFL